jgi:DNA-binding NtrC family response regulator
MAATNADLAARVAEGRFRGDLYWRLAVVELVVPPLRERAADIEGLAQAFLRQAARDAGRAGLGFAPDAVAALEAHAWPGNVRELRNRVERAALLAEGPAIGAPDLFAEKVPPAPAVTLAEARDAAERAHIRRVLARCGGRAGDAARVLDVSRTTLWERMRRLGIAAADEA